MATIELDPRWMITGHLNGGYLAAVCGQAASEALDDATPLTISTHYLAAARAGGPADVEVDVLRRGRLSTARVRLSRDGTLLLESLVTTGTPAPDPRSLEHVEVPAVPAWEDCVDAGASAFAAQPGMDVLHHVELRLDRAQGQAIAGGTALERAVVHGHLAYRDGSPADTFLVAAAWDLMPPAPWFVHFWNALPTVAAQVVLYPGELVGPLVLEARCETIRDGIADETARVWDASGRLVASSRQTAVVIPG